MKIHSGCGWVVGLGMNLGLPRFYLYIFNDHGLTM